MNNNFEIKAIGVVNINDNEYAIKINKEYITALKNIDGFSHLQIIWWGHLCNSVQGSNHFSFKKLFKKGPDEIGVFATRSPVRPNPILISIIEVTRIDYNKGIIYTPHIDAEDKTPVLDIKPYYLMERVKDCEVPQWCEHWPQWYEDTLTFNWKEEINF